MTTTYSFVSARKFFAIMLAALCFQCAPRLDAAQDMEDFPVFFALPASAMLPNNYGLTKYLPGEITKGKYHPSNPPYFQAARVSHAGAAKKLAASGMVQTGDVILTLRPEWAYRGAYPDMMMGISHAGFAFVENGQVYNLDNPITSFYIGNFSGKHYTDAKTLHIVRPRNLTEKQKKNLLNWAKRIYANANRFFGGYEPLPGRISFNHQYAEPSYVNAPNFPATLGRIALGDKDNAGLSVFCSEFVWAMLALKNCDPEKDAKQFISDTPPYCVKPPFSPLPLMGDYFENRESGQLGFGDGALAVIDAISLPEKERAAMIHQVFEKARPRDTDSDSYYEEGAVYDAIETYYSGIAAKTPEALKLKKEYNAFALPNYSPAAFLVNTLLPDGKRRLFDVVGTVVFDDGIAPQVMAERDGKAGEAQSGPAVRHGIIRH